MVARMNVGMIVISAGLYAGAAVLFTLHKKWKATAVKVTGTVSQVREGLRRDNSDDNSSLEKVYYPTVKYEAEGRSFEHVFGETNATTKPYTVGQQVEIYFQPGSPDKPLLGAIGMKLALAWICLIAATITLVVSFVAK